MKTEGHARKEENKACEGGKDEKENQMEGTKNNEPKLVRKRRRTSLNTYALRVHLRRRRVPMDPRIALTAAVTCALPKWLAALTAAVTQKHEPARGSINGTEF